MERHGLCVGTFVSTIDLFVTLEPCFNTEEYLHRHLSSILNGLIIVSYRTY
jgi:hypothetical protein